MKLTGRIITTILLVLMLVLAIFAWIDVQKEQAILDQSMTRGGNSLAGVIATFSIESLLIEDYPVLESALTSIGQASDTILQIEVLHDGQLVASYREGNTNEGRAFRSDILLNTPGQDAKLKLGEVRLWLSERENQAARIESLKTIGIFFVVVFLVLLALLTYVLRRQVLSRIIALNHYATEITPMQLEGIVHVGDSSLVPVKRIREIDTSKDEIDQLSQNLEILYDAVTDRETMLRQYSKNLEREVGLRVKDLKIAKEQAESSDRAKSLFLANISHEIRTPMNGIVGFTRLLERSALEPGQAEYIKSISQSVSALQRVIDGLLDYSRIEAGPVAVESAPLNLYSLLDEVVASHAEHAMDKGLQLIQGINRSLNLKVVGDYKHLKLVLGHLLENAIKFTDEGYVSIWVEVDVQPSGQVLKFLVEDTGSGIAPEKQAALFKAFTQVDNSMSRRHGGSGLGLAIVDQLVQAMEGEVGVRSRPGAGASFWFSIPYRPDYQESDSPDQDNGKRVLLLDSNALSRRASRHLLQRLGYAVSEWKPESGDEPHAAYDLLYCVLASKDWREKLSRLRDRLPFQKPAVFVVNRGNPLAEYGEELPPFTAIVSAAEGYELIRHRLQAFLEPVGASVPEQGAERSENSGSAGTQLDILLVDDNRVSALLIKVLLSEQGYQVTLASTIEEALIKLDDQEYGLILLDTALQGGVGLAVCDKLSGISLRGRQVPLIALVSSEFLERFDNLAEAAVDDYLLKPVDETKLLAAIDKWRLQA